MDKKSNLGFVTEGHMRCSNSPSVDSARAGRRRFLCSIMGAGASALFTSKPAISDVTGSGTLTLSTERATFSINSTGSLSAITANGRNLFAPGQPAPILSLRVAGKFYPPNRAAWEQPGDVLTLIYPHIDTAAVVSVHAKRTHVTFGLADLRTARQVELALWGPYPVTIGDLVGEVVGVVRDSESP